MQSWSMIRVAVAATTVFFSLSGTAQTAEFDVLIDTDRSAASGCSVTPSGGATLTGFEQRIRASVDLASFEVVSLEQSSCAGGGFGAPAAIPDFSVPYPLALNTGTAGADAVELAVARAALGATNLSQLRLTFLTDNGTGSDVLATADGNAGSGPIVIGLPVQIPALSIWGLAALVVVLLGLAWMAHRRLGRVGAVMAVMLVATAAWAMTFVPDGDLSDWGGRAPNATDPAGDATDGSAAIDLVAGFVVLAGDDLFFRMDVSDTENQAPVAVDDVFATDEDMPLSVAAPGVLANDSDAELDPITAVLDAGPANAASFMLNADGSFDYTPATDFNGSDSFTYVANDGQADSAPATVTITVNPINDPPVAVDDTATTDEDQQVDIDVLANDSDVDGDLDPATVTVTSGPANGTTSVNPTTGVVTYTKSGDFNGADSFEYEVCDDGIPLPAACATALVTITINAINDAPTAAAGSATTDEDVAVTVTLSGGDIDGDALTFAIATPPANGSLGTITQLTPTSAEVTYTPTSDFNGADGFTFTVNDGTVSSTAATVSIAVDPVNDAPLADAQAVTTDEDVPVVITLAGSDVEGDALTFTIAASPANGSLSAVTPVDATSAQVTYTPAADFNGADGFTFTANDGTVPSAAAAVTITVDPVDDAPVAVADATTVVEDSGANTIDVLANDADVDGGAISIVSVTQPSNGSVVITGGGTGVSYTPSADYCNDPPGTTPEIFNYTLAPGGSSTMVTVSVTCVDDPPVAVADAATVTEDSAASAIDVLANDTDVDGGPISVISVIQPANGTVNITGGGTAVSYAPDADYCNNQTGGVPDAFTYTLNGGSSASVSVTVICVNDPPVAAAKLHVTHSGIGLTIDAASHTGELKEGATDVDNTFAELSVELVGSPTPATATVTLLSAADGSFYYEPPGGVSGNGAGSFQFRVCDNGDAGLGLAPACSATVTASFNITGPDLWFVDDTDAAGCGADCNGSRSKPLVGLAALPAVATRGTGDRIFAFSGTYAAGHAFAGGERLIGQGATGSTFDAFLDVQVPANGALDARPAVAGTRPVVQGQVTLADSVTAQGFDITPPAAIQGMVGNGAFAGISVSQMNVTTTNATAVSLTGLTGDFTFDRVTANGGPVGIVLDNSNTTAGSFTVSGDGTNARNGAGGTIQNTTGDGVFLSNARNVTLRQMNLVDIGDTANSLDITATTNDHAIESRGGGDIRLSAVTIESPFGSGWEAFDITGVNAIDSNSLITGLDLVSNFAGIRVTNANTDFTSFSILDSTVDHADPTPGDPATNGNADVVIATTGSAGGSFIVDNSSFTGARATAITVAAGNAPGSTGTLVTSITNSSFEISHPINGQNNLGLQVLNGSTHNLTVNNNTLRDIGRGGSLSGQVIAQKSHAAVLDATVNGNTVSEIDNQHGLDAVSVSNSNGGRVDWEADNNQVFDVGSRGVFVTARGNEPDMDIALRNNTIGTSVDPVASNPTTVAQRGIDLDTQTNAFLQAALTNNTVVANTSGSVLGGLASSVMFINTEEFPNPNPGSAVTHVTLDGNVFTNQNATGSPNVIARTRDEGLTLAVDYDGNVANGSSSSVLMEEFTGGAGSTVTVEDLATVAADNPGVTTFTIPGSVADHGGNVPEPDF